jgi:hypothetical protein
VLEYRSVGIITLFYYPALQYSTAPCGRQKGSPANVMRKVQRDESRDSVILIGVPKREIGRVLKLTCSARPKINRKIYYKRGNQK